MEATTFLKEQYLKSAFKMFDTDGSGKIDVKELAALLSGEEFKDVYTTDELADAIKEVDENGDGEIDFEEFMQMMMGSNENKNK
jgi:calcium-dependent protein kinase